MDTPRGQGDAVLRALGKTYDEESGAGGRNGRARHAELLTQFQFDDKKNPTGWTGQRDASKVTYHGQYDSFARFFRTLDEDDVYAALEKWKARKRNPNANDAHAAQIAELEGALAQANAEKQVLDDSKGEQIAELQDALAQANAAKQELGRLLKRSHTSQGFCNQVELAFLNMLAASASPVGTLSNENVHEWVSTTQENVRRVTGIIHKWNSTNDEVTKGAEETLKTTKPFATKVSVHTPYICHAPYICHGPQLCTLQIKELLVRSKVAVEDVDKIAAESTDMQAKHSDEFWAANNAWEKKTESTKFLSRMITDAPTLTVEIACLAKKLIDNNGHEVCPIAQTARMCRCNTEQCICAFFVAGKF
jgi:hypothetical protein